MSNTFSRKRTWFCIGHLANAGWACDNPNTEATTLFVQFCTFLSIFFSLKNVLSSYPKRTQHIPTPNTPCTPVWMCSVFARLLLFKQAKHANNQYGTCSNSRYVAKKRFILIACAWLLFMLIAIPWLFFVFFFLYFGLVSNTDTHIHHIRFCKTSSIRHQSPSVCSYASVLNCWRAPKSDKTFYKRSQYMRCTNVNYIV